MQVVLDIGEDRIALVLFDDFLSLDLVLSVGLLPGLRALSLEAWIRLRLLLRLEATLDTKTNGTDDARFSLRRLGIRTRPSAVCVVVTLYRFVCLER